MKTLVKNKLEKFDCKKRSTKDKRKKVAWAVFSYFDRNNPAHEYRKSFEAPLGTSESEFWEISPNTITVEP